MAGNSLIGLYLYSRKTSQFCYGVFKEDKGLNFLADSLLYANPTFPELNIGPKTMVVWND